MVEDLERSTTKQHSPRTLKITDFVTVWCGCICNKLEMAYGDTFVIVVSWVVILLVMSVNMEEVSLGCIQDGGRERCFTYQDGEDAMVYRAAAGDFCAAHNNASLAIIDSASVNGLLAKNRSGQAWIRLRLIKFYKWIHASTTEDAAEYYEGTLAFFGNDCAMFSTRDGFKSGKCGETHRYLCGRSWTSKGGTCPGTLVGGMCAVVGTRSAANWYTARYYCAVDHNSDLLSVDIYPEYSDILNGSLAGSTYWIDVTSQLWVWKDDFNDTVLGHMKYNNWKTGHPITRHDCAVVEPSTGQWESVACSGNQYSPVCEQVTYANELRPTDDSSLFTGDGIIAAYTVAAVAFLVAAASIIALIHYKRTLASATKPAKQPSASHELGNNQHVSSLHVSSPQSTGAANASSSSINAEYENDTFQHDVPPLQGYSQPYEELRQYLDVVDAGQTQYAHLQGQTLS